MTDEVVVETIPSAYAREEGYTLEEVAELVLASAGRHLRDKVGLLDNYSRSSRCNLEEYPDFSSIPAYTDESITIDRWIHAYLCNTFGTWKGVLYSDDVLVVNNIVRLLVDVIPMEGPVVSTSTYNEKIDTQIRTLEHLLAKRSK